MALSDVQLSLMEEKRMLEKAMETLEEYVKVGDARLKGKIGHYRRKEERRGLGMIFK